MSAWLRSLPKEYVQCRKLGHAWLEGASSHYKVGRSFVGLELTCERCRMVRRDLFDPRGDLAARRYVQPDGYSKPRGEDRPFGYELTRELVRGRAFTEVEKAPALAAMMKHLVESGRLL